MAAGPPSWWRRSSRWSSPSTSSSTRSPPSSTSRRPGCSRSPTRPGRSWPGSPATSRSPPSAGRGTRTPSSRRSSRRYARLGSRIRLATVDPERNPTWSKKYDTSGGGLREGSLVVARGERFRTIDMFDMYNYEMSGQQPRLTGLSVEQKVSSALQYVNAERSITVYTVQGHGEKTLADYGLPRPWTGRTTRGRTSTSSHRRRCPPTRTSCSCSRRGATFPRRTRRSCAPGLPREAGQCSSSTCRSGRIRCPTSRRS